jgi:serine protease AprX
MNSPAPSPQTEKAVWGRAVLFSLIALSFAAVPVEAQLLKGSARISSADERQLAREARKARRHAKLDQHLNDSVEDNENAESNVIIEFHDDRDAVNLIRGKGGKAGRRLGILKARAAKMPNRVLKTLAGDPRVKRIHHDRVAQGYVGRTAVTVGARAVQQLMGFNGAGIGVAVVDSGITAWHDDLSVANGAGQRVAHFVDFVNGYTHPYDDWGHGTHVAGIVAGNGFDSNGARNAIAPGAHIIALKALNGSGQGTISQIIAAIDYAVANKDQFNIRVINLSLGASVTESYHTDPLTLAAKRAVDAGIVVVSAAGNLGRGANGLPQYGAIGAPGNAPWVITVGASSTNGTVLRQDDSIAPFSSRGPTRYDYAAKPDLVAPGYGIISLSDPASLFYQTKAPFLLGGLLATSYTPYLTLSGTSMATPVVAGTVALMLQANPNLTPNLVKAILQYTAQEYPGYDALTQGAGFLNARGAVVLSQYFAQAAPGSRYPVTNGWSKQIFWGNKRVRGGVLTPDGTAWDSDVVWGSTPAAAGKNIVWGDNCADASCDNIVWGNNDDDNIVWGNSNDDNIVWGNYGEDNIVWGNDCGGADCDNIVWGNQGEDNIVWGNAEGLDNIVWGNNDADNIVWGNNGDDNIVWGNNGGDNIVWGNSLGTLLNNVVFGDETNEVNSLPASMWDVMFPLDARWPAESSTSSQPAPTPTKPLTSRLRIGGLR